MRKDTNPIFGIAAGIFVHNPATEFKANPYFKHLITPSISISYNIYIYS